MKEESTLTATPLSKKKQHGPLGKAELCYSYRNHSKTEGLVRPPIMTKQRAVSSSQTSVV